MTLHRPRPCRAHACIFLSRHNVSNPLYLLRPMSSGRAACVRHCPLGETIKPRPADPRDRASARTARLNHLLPLRAPLAAISCVFYENFTAPEFIVPPTGQWAQILSGCSIHTRQTRGDSVSFAITFPSSFSRSRILFLSFIFFSPLFRVRTVPFFFFTRCSGNSWLRV